MVFYKRILFGLSWTGLVMNIYWGILAGTYVVIQVVTFTDCRPLHLYWQVVPDPGTCSEALGQLIILGALNIFTDILLIILPMPALLRVRRTFWACVSVHYRLQSSCTSRSTFKLTSFQETSSPLALLTWLLPRHHHRHPSAHKLLSRVPTSKSHDMGIGRVSHCRDCCQRADPLHITKTNTNAREVNVCFYGQWK